jgi:hypothetical protein
MAFLLSETLIYLLVGVFRSSKFKKPMLYLNLALERISRLFPSKDLSR